MAGSLCKPPDPVSFDRNATRNWQEFEEQLKWFIEGSECDEKSDMLKIGIMLTHADKHARKTFQWAKDGDKRKFDKVKKAFQDC